MDQIQSDAQPAAPSAVPPPAPVTPSAIDTAVSSNDFAAFRAAKRAELDPKSTSLPQTPQAASSPAGPDSQAASTEAQAPAASEPAKPPKSNAETRVQELLAERHQHRTRIAELEAQLHPRAPAQPQTAPAASSPAPVADTAFPDFDAWLTQLGNADKSYETYIDARTDFRVEQREHTRQAKDAEVSAKRELETKQAAYREQTETFVADHPDFFEAVAPILTASLDTPTAKALAEAIQANGPDLLYALAKDQATFNRLVRLPERLALWELGKFAATLSKAVPLPPKVVTSAPEPPTTLGRKPTESASDVDAAVKNGDVRAFRSARLRERTANMR